MSTFQSEVYECARNTSSIKLGTDNSEWINEFSSGIEVKKGDQVRILGSFVHEGSSGEEIEIAQDSSVNISYSPYIIAATLGTADPTKNLIDIGQYADPAQSTDAFGIEPPVRIDPNPFTTTNVANYPFPIDNTIAYSNPLATATPFQLFGLNRTLWTTQGDKAELHGTNIKTNAYDPTQAADNNINLQNYDNFALRSVPNEFYISQIVKKFILPMAKGHNNENGGLVGNIFYDYEPLLDDVVDGQPGMFSGVPKPGMCFATCDIGSTSGLYDDDGEAWRDAFWGAPGDAGATPENGGSGSSRYFGLPNLKSGVQSMIGTIIAVRPIKHFINGMVVGCFEIYVSDWVNPAQLVKGGMISIEFPADRLVQIKSGATVINTAGIFHKHVHGSGELPNGYNNNPSWNNINGAYTNLSDAGYYLGMNSSTPSIEGYETLNYEEQIVGSANPTPSKYQKGYGMPQGLSFPWNGSHTGGMRMDVPAVGDKDFRANSMTYWYKNTANDGIYSTTYITNVIYTPTGTPGVHDAEVGIPNGTPVCLGGYLICNKDTMLKVARGEYDITDDPTGDFYSAVPGQYPRVWFDYALQINTSDYRTRHYEANSWRNSAGSETLVETAPNDTRYGYAMCGQPPNMNWRKSQASDVAGTTSYVYDFADGAYPMGGGASQSNLDTTTGDGMPRYWSTTDGRRDWANDPATPNMNGTPAVWGGYNNCLNSIHFQQKETGDTKLGVGSVIGDGRTHNLTLAFNNLATGDQDVIWITKATLLDRSTGALYTPTEFDFIQVLHDNGTKSALMVDAVSISAGGVVDAGDYWALTLQSYGGGASQYTPRWRIMINVPFYTKVCLFRAATPAGGAITPNGSSYLDIGIGANAKPWCTDLLMIREQITKISVKQGFYTEPQLAAHINDQLHLSPSGYKKLYGTKNADGIYSLPTNVGVKEQALGSEPSVVNGNFLMTYIPDVSYGFTPVVASNATDVDLDASTKLMNDELYTYDSLRDGGGDLIFYYYNEIEALRTYNGTTVRKISDTPTTLGKHVKIYSIPKMTTSGTFKPQIHLMRLKGGALNKDDYIVPADATPPGTGFPYWAQLENRWAGTYEMLRDAKGNGTPAVVPTSLGIYNYRCRLTRNLCSFGGGSKLWCGANNITISWQDIANRYSINNTYTPIRPHEPADPSNPNQDFGIGDAVPSAIINAKNTGAKTALLTGIYINDLNAGTFTQSEWGDATIGDSYEYDIVNNDVSLNIGQTFLDSLGYSSVQVANNNNNFKDYANPYIYAGELEQSGSAIRVGAKIDTAINGSNPFASNCLNIAPVVQFFVEVDTNDFFAINVPLKGIDPYYFIGSDFPTKKFYGNQTGDKLPVIGICARNFHAFNFVFDLGGSSISYTMEEDTTIHSIRTKIYTSQLGNPSQLSPYSSIIYLITRNNAPSTKSIQMPLAQIAAQIIEQNATQNDDMIGQYYNQPLANIRFGSSNIPQPPEFYRGSGSPPPPQTPPSSDDDF